MRNLDLRFIVVLLATFAIQAAGSFVIAQDVSVTSAANAGTGTLRDALSKVGEGGTITVNPSLNNATIELASGASLTLPGKSFSIKGNGITISGKGSTQILHSDPGASKTITIEGIKFIKGGIDNDWNGDEYDGFYPVIAGAAIYHYSGKLIINSCLFIGNSTSKSSSGRGGAIYNNATMEIYGSTLTDNMTKGEGAAIYNEGSIEFGANIVLYNNTGSSQLFNASGKTFTSLGYNVYKAKKKEISWTSTDYESDPYGDGDVDIYMESGELTELGKYNCLFVPTSFAKMPLRDVNGKDRGFDKNNKTHTGAFNYLQAHTAIKVTTTDDNSTAESTPGTLRYALKNVSDNDTIVVDPALRGQTIKLYGTGNTLHTPKVSFTLKGNGIIISGNGNTEIMFANSGKDKTAVIENIHFDKGGSANDWSYDILDEDFPAFGGAAILVYSGNVIIKSCIFTNNKLEGSNASGGALHVSSNVSLQTSLEVYASTFIANSVTKNKRGGAIHNDGAKLTLGGNLFQANIGTADVSGSGATTSTWFTSKGYNVYQSKCDSWITTDKFYGTEDGSEIDPLYDITNINGTLVRLGQKEALIVPESLKDIPAIDFSGSARIYTNGMTQAGAYSYVKPDPITLTVNKTDDNATAINTEGTLRYALAKVTDEDIIVIDPSLAGKAITLMSGKPLHTQPGISFTLKGNGVIISGGSARTQLLYALPGEGKNIYIENVNFDKGGQNCDWNYDEDEYTDYPAYGGGAIYLGSGNMVINSCIFSNNKLEGANPSGGAIMQASGTSLSIYGSTFVYNESKYATAGAIRNDGGTLVLGGNLFQNNKNTKDKSFSDVSGTFTSEGYNMFCTNPADMIETDRTYADEEAILALENGQLTEAGKQTAWIVSDKYENMPEKDFNGTNRIYIKTKTHAGAYSYDFVPALPQVTVTSILDDINTEGTLRYIVANEKDEVMITFDDAIKNEVIKLNEPLNITHSMSFDGNGITISGESYLETSTSSLIKIASDAIVEMSHMRFINTNASTSEGGAIFNEGNLTIKACIFDNNQTGSASINGGAIYSGHILTVTGSTFINNHSEYNGGAIFCSAGTVNLFGNLFYNNTVRQGASGNDLYTYSSVICNTKYNVYNDSNLKAEEIARMWQDPSNIVYKADTPLTTPTYKLRNFDDNSAQNIAIPESEVANMPQYDFRGSEIIYPAYAGAVQTLSAKGVAYEILQAIGEGEYTVTPASEADADGIYAANTKVTLSTTEDNFAYWMINGVKNTDMKVELTLTTPYITLQPYFAYYVTTNVDDAENPGSLRSILANSDNHAIIRFSKDIESNTINVTKAFEINKPVTIEANGITLDGQNETNILITKSNAVANISGIRFYQGYNRTDGGAISVQGGTLNLTSCILANNEVAGNSYMHGGAINNEGSLSAYGCTFINNSTNGKGGAIYSTKNSLQLFGNIFYKNTAAVEGSDISTNAQGGINSDGYNIYGTAGTTFRWTDTDKSVIAENLAKAESNVYSGELTEAGQAIALFIPEAITDMPQYDFNGNERGVKNGFYYAGAITYYIPVGIDNANADKESLEITVGKQIITVTSSVEISITIYSTSGLIIKSFISNGDQPQTISLPSGIYIVNGQKVAVM